MPALGEALRALQHALAEVGVGWYVFGAQAVAVRGVARATQDVDVTLSAVPDVDRVLATLHANGFRGHGRSARGAATAGSGARHHGAQRQSIWAHGFRQLRPERVDTTTAARVAELYPEAPRLKEGAPALGEAVLVPVSGSAPVPFIDVGVGRRS